MATGGDDWERRKALKEAPELRAELEELHKKVSTLEKEKEDMTSKMRATEHNNNDLSTRNVELEKEIQTQQTKRAHLEQQLKLSEAESERLQREREDLQTKRAHLEQQLQETTAESARLQRELDTQASQFARMMASKDRERSEAARRAQAAEKSLAVTERRLKAEGAKLQARLESERQEKEQLESKLENEMRLCEEFRRLLDKEPDKFHQQVAAALERVERGLHQVAEDLSHRQKVSDPDEPFMDRLPPDVKELCMDLQRKIGGHGLKFAQLLLGSSFSLETEDLEEEGLFFSSRKFWLCVKKWVEASSRAGVPLTSQHLRQACRGLVVDPTTLTPIRPEHEQALESNFRYLAENIKVVDVMPYLRSSPLMTADAWSFLLHGRLESQKVDRLLAVVYSMGEEGYKDLIAAMRDSWNQHVLAIFPQDEAKEEALTRAGLPSGYKMAEADTANEVKSSATAAPPQVTDADIRTPSDDEEDDEDSEEPVRMSLTKALAEMESRVVARVKEVESSVKETLENVRRSESSLSKAVEGMKGDVAEVKSVSERVQAEMKSVNEGVLAEVRSASEGVLAGIEQVREVARSVEKNVDGVKQESKAASEALGEMLESRFQAVEKEVKNASVGVLAGMEQVREVTRLVEKEVGVVKRETNASSEALGGMVERGFQGVAMEVNRARDGVLAEMKSVNEGALAEVRSGNEGVLAEMKSVNEGVLAEMKSVSEGVQAGMEQVREDSRSLGRAVDGVKQEVAKSGSEAGEIKKRMAALEEVVKRSQRGLLDRLLAKREPAREQASGGREGGEAGGEA